MQAFAIAPATAKLLWFLPLLLLPVVVVLTVFIMTLTGARGARFEVGDDGLRLRGDFYGRLVPWDQLRASEARRVDFTASPDLTPTRRTWGTGLPGYQSGWFRLANGEKALLYLTDRSRAVHVPTTAGYSLLLSPADPDSFVAALRAIRTSP
jgi:hypothetical protein